MSGLLTVIAIGVVGYAAAVLFGISLARAAGRKTPPPPDPAIREDQEVRMLDALWEMPTREPLA